MSAPGQHQATSGQLQLALSSDKTQPTYCTLPFTVTFTVSRPWDAVAQGYHVCAGVLQGHTIRQHSPVRVAPLPWT